MRSEYPPFWSDGRKWCACGDGIEDDEDECKICIFIDKIDTLEKGDD